MCLYDYQQVTRVYGYNIFFTKKHVGCLVALLVCEVNVTNLIYGPGLKTSTRLT